MTDKSSFKDTLTRLKELDELELVSLSQKQLPYVTAAYEELMRRYQSQLHSIALRYLANHADAEEVVHDVMLKVFIHIKKFKIVQVLKHGFTDLLITSLLISLDLLPSMSAIKIKK